MAWTNITNAQLAIGAPIRSIDLLALRDNITAQANGDAGAPKQQTAGIADAAVTAPKINFVTNGLQNSSGSLAIACPSFNTVGSYCFVAATESSSAIRTFTAGSNYSAGGPNSGGLYASISTNINLSTSISGTWKWMGATVTISGQEGYANGAGAIACRVS